MFAASMKKSLFLVLTACVSAVAADPPKQIDIHGLDHGATVIQDVVIPEPSEIFGVLDKLGRPNWPEVLHPIKGTIKPPGPREQTALLLGTVIAEGFIAVEAENAEEVKNIGRSVLSLSKAIGVERAVVPRTKAIIDGADKKEWAGVRKELDKAQHDVQQAMRELGDADLSQLVSLGGWLRGTEALTAVVKKKYTEDGAELLHQPVLLDYFHRRLDSMKKKDNPMVLKMREGLEEIRPLMGTEGSTISEKAAVKIGSTAERLDTLIHSKQN
jgi:hypothetical protein